MLASLTRLIERQILKARAEGKLQGLEGEGKPLPDHPEEAYSDAATGAGLRIMREAGVVPEEFTLARELDAARKALATAPDRKAAMARVADLEMRLNIARDARRKFMS